MNANNDLARLQRSFDWGLEHSVPDRELVCMLRPLVRATLPESPQGVRCRLYLAERLLRVEPSRRAAWEAANLCRQVLRHCRGPGEQARAQGALGLSLTVLGQYKAARAAYRRALQMDTFDPVVAHNLGHLEVVRFGRVTAGLRWLELAHRELEREPEIAASFAYALVLDHQEQRARRVLGRALSPTLAAAWVERWCAPSTGNVGQDAR